MGADPTKKISIPSHLFYRGKVLLRSFSAYLEEDFFWSEQEQELYPKPPRPSMGIVLGFSHMEGLSPIQTQQNPLEVCLGASHWLQTLSPGLDLPGTYRVSCDCFPKYLFHS